jgi:predicted nucleic acid-binding protein
MTGNVFLDTSGWLALLNSAELLHAEANLRWQQIVLAKRSITLTDWIVAETGNGLARSDRKNRLSESLARVLSTSRTEFVVIDAALMHRALDLYGQHADKTWGLVDCASFLVMRDRGMSEAFTCDRHFEQAGFKCLLYPDGRALA